MLQAGLAGAVCNAHAFVRQHAHWVTPSPGGQGAVREVCELVMYARGTYSAALSNYLTTGDETRRAPT